jgi:hypothetical protein
MAKAHEERRSERRIPVDAQVRVRHMRKELIASTQDMSQGGIYFFCDSPVEADSDLELIVQMPPEVNAPKGGRWMSLYARVVRVQKADAGYGVAAKITHTETVDLT